MSSSFSGDQCDNMALIQHPVYTIIIKWLDLIHGLNIIDRISGGAHDMI